MALFNLSPYVDPYKDQPLPAMPQTPTKKGLLSQLGGLLAKADAPDDSGLTFWDRLGTLGADMRDDPTYGQLNQQKIDAKTKDYKAAKAQKEANAQADQLGLTGRERLVYMANPTAWAKENATRFGSHNVAAGELLINGPNGDIYNPRTFTAGDTIYNTTQGGAPESVGTVAPTFAAQTERMKAEQPAIQKFQPGDQFALIPKQGIAPQADQNAPRGIRNNNPGNIKDGAFARGLPGYAGADPQGFAIFSDPQAGAQATGALLQNYGKSGLNTISQIVSKWAPPTENNTGAYINSVAQQLHVDPNQPLDMNNPQVISALTQSIAQHENGAYPTQQSAQPQSQAQPQGLPSGVQVINPAGNNPGLDQPVANGATGDALLKAVDPQTASQVKALAEGRMQFPSGFALKSPYWQHMIALVSQYDPTFDATNYNSRAKARAAFTSGKQAQNVQSFNTAIGHLGSLSNEIEDLHNSGFTPANMMKNAIYGATSPDAQSVLARFNADKLAVINELPRVFSGTGGAVSDRKEWEKEINSSKSPAALHATVQALTQLIQSRIDATNSSADTAGLDFRSFLSPKAQATLAKLENPTPKQTMNAALKAKSGSGDKFTVGQIYTDAAGNKAKYNGNGQWEPQ